MLELVFAPCSPLAGGDVNWIAKTDDEIIDATMGELARLFPTGVHFRCCTSPLHLPLRPPPAVSPASPPASPPACPPASRAAALPSFTLATPRRNRKRSALADHLKAGAQRLGEAAQVRRGQGACNHRL